MKHDTCQCCEKILTFINSQVRVRSMIVGLSCCAPHIFEEGSWTVREGQPIRCQPLISHSTA